MSVKLNSSGGGSITLQEPSTASNRTLTLPDNTGNLISSADSGTVSQAMLASNVAGTGPAFRAYMSSAQTITGLTFTKLQFNTEVFDTASCYDTATYRFTPNVAGYYQVSAATYFAATAQLYIYKNGSANMTGPYLNSTGHSILGLVYLNGTTDYIECYYFGSANVTTSNNNEFANIFWASLVRSA